MGTLPATVVTATITYDPPATKLGAMIAKRVNPDRLLTFVGALLTVTCGYGLYRALS